MLAQAYNDSGAALLRLLLALVLTLIAAMMPMLLHAAGATGRLSTGRGVYRIETPATWRPGGRLLIYNHGFSMDAISLSDPPALAPSSGIRDYWLQQGYALAAGSYGTRGWAMFDLAQEQLALYQEFVQRFGVPGEVLLVGGSLGGLVSARSAEDLSANGAPVAGVYALCPPLGGARTWDQAVDARLLFDAVCPDHPLPSGSTSNPWTIDYGAIPADLGDLENTDTLLAVAPVANRVRQCLGFFQPPVFDTQGQLARRAQLKQLLGLTSDDFLVIQLGYATFALSDLVNAPEKLAGFNAFDNRFVDYGDALINARVRRISRDALAAVKLGAVSNTLLHPGHPRLLAVTTDRDELVFPEHLALLPRDDPQVASAWVRENRPGHCQFSEAEVIGGFEALRQWVDGGSRPDAARLNQACSARRGDVERCAFVDLPTHANLDTRIRPRGLALDRIVASHSGVWSDPNYSGEGVLIEVQANGVDAVVGWYSYPPLGEEGEQTWIVGLGRVSADGIHVAQAQRFSGLRFGPPLAGALRGEPFGEMTFAFERCGQPQRSDALGAGRLRYDGGTAFGRGERSLRQLSWLGARPNHCNEAATPAAPDLSRYSGTWYRGGNQSGDGVVLQVQDDGFALLAWYTYDPQGRPAWLFGTTRVSDPQRLELDLLRPRGTHFAPAFDPADVRSPLWGRVTLQFDRCDAARITWSSVEPGWNAGSISLIRLSSPAGVRCH